MAHSFLIESGYWNVSGHWLKPNLAPVPLKGEIEIAWKRKNWFKMTTSLICDEETATNLVCQCRGNFDYEEKYYTYVSQHGLLGNIKKGGL